MINIMVVDDHPAVAQGTKYILEQEEDFQVDMTVSSIEAVELMGEKKYDVVILDLHMPEINGIDLAKIIYQKYQTKIIIYTGYDIENYFNLLIECGVAGLVSKTSTAHQLINAIKCAIRDEAVLPITLLRQLRRTSLIIADNKSNVEVTINEEEQAILIEIDKGLTNRMISQKLHVSQRTIEHRMTTIFQKLSVNSRLKAVSKAKELGLIPDDSSINKNSSFC
ncbi:response regulator [Bacillus manliponensis]|uniref:response regulator n=1 Tax=Bacillus manliponensis TaxID=574376 RepID=UPI003516DEDB